MSDPQAVLFYRLLIRSAQMFMPTTKSKEFMINRVKSEFRKNKDIKDPMVINAELQRAYAVLMNSIDETTRKMMMRQ